MPERLLLCGITADKHLHVQLSQDEMDHKAGTQRLHGSFIQAL